MKRIWVTNGNEVHRILESELDTYINKGFVRGKKKDGVEIKAWNKGLTKADPRVKAYTDNKPKTYASKTTYCIDNKCTNCGNELKIEYIFCPYCNKRIIHNA